MNEEYDFTDAEQGQFYIPIEDLDIPECIEQEVKDYFVNKQKEKA